MMEECLKLKLIGIINVMNKKRYIDIHKCKSNLKYNNFNETHVWSLIFEEKM
jgi:hypothetical protein